MNDYMDELLWINISLDNKFNKSGPYHCSHSQDSFWWVRIELVDAVATELGDFFYGML
jgi:hypothetical protein